RDLSQRLDSLASQPGVDSAILVRTNLELAEMREMVGKAANPIALDRIEKQLEALAARIDPLTGGDRIGRADVEGLSKELRHLARQFDPALALNAMDDKLRALEERMARRMEQSQSFAGEGQAQGLSGDILASDVSGLEAMMRALSDKIDAARKPDAGAPQFDALQRQIASIASRMEKSDEGLRALSSIERAVSDLFVQMDSLRDIHRETAEIAARKAAEMLARDGGGGQSRDSLLPQDNPRMDALVSDVTALVKSRDSIDRRTQDTLEAVHGALEKIVGRLNTLESEVVTQSRTAASHDRAGSLPAEGLPVRAAIHAATKAAGEMGRAGARGMETRIAGDRKATAPTPEQAVDASVLVRPGSRRAQPIAAPAIEEKSSRFSLKLPFLKGKSKDAPPAADGVQDVAGGRFKPAKPGQEPSSRTTDAGAAMPGGDFDTADMATAALTAPAPALHPSSLGPADMPLEPGSGRPGSQMDMS
ncbi:MAG: hypothetical protein ACRCXM_10165, partial [Beijerinckiaceae bacterium]